MPPRIRPSGTPRDDAAGKRALIEILRAHCTVPAAAQASIGAAARELHLPTVRTESAGLAEIANRERQTHLSYLAEVLAAEVDGPARTTPHPTDQRRQVPATETTRRLQRRRRPHRPPTTLGHLAAGHYMDAGEPVVLLGDSDTGKGDLLIGPGLATCE